MKQIYECYYPHRLYQDSSKGYYDVGLREKVLIIATEKIPTQCFHEFFSLNTLQVFRGYYGAKLGDYFIKL